MAAAQETAPAHPTLVLRSPPLGPTEKAAPPVIAATKGPSPQGPITQVAAKEVTQLPPPESIHQAPTPKPNPPALPGTSLPITSLPISLDTVLRLAEEQNAEIAQARARVREAYAEQAIAKTKWLPDLYVGTAYYRHEGGNQNPDGTFVRSSFSALFAGLEVDGKLDIRDVAYQQVNAQRQVWQQKGDLSRVSNETLLDAANTYIDLLTARTGEAIARDLEQKFQALLKDAEKLAAVEKPARVEVFRIQTEVDSQHQTIVKLHGQAAAAVAKLIYLLHLDPCAELVPVDGRLVPFDLIDPSPPACDLVAQALQTGPGVREMEGLLNLIQDSLARSKGLGQLIPILEVCMAEGGFGAGPGDRLDWDNRWDLGVKARWNLTTLAAMKERQEAAQAKVQQAQLAYQDLRGKLTAGVQEARETSLSSRDEIKLGTDQILSAKQAYELSDQRRKDLPQAGSFSEVLLALGSFGRAEFAYLNAINTYDKAQLRLMMLLGPAACKGHGGTVAK
jgi:outer membrane protein TolC